MKIPDKIKIGKHVIRIRSNTPDEDDEWIGRLDRKKLSIDLNPNYPRSIQEEALIHELLHITDIIYGLGLTEHQITVLAERIYSNFLPLEIEGEAE